jgi:hypothetical protein
MKQKLATWRDHSWSFVRKYLLSYGLKLITKSVTGPWGWIATKVLPILIDQLAKPAWLWTTRKINKILRKKEGKQQAKEIRDAETNDDVFDSINRS